MAHKLYSMTTIGKICTLTHSIGNKLIPSMVLASKPQIAKLHSVKLQGQNYSRLYEPYDYENKGYSSFHPLWEGTTKRFDENSKIILVEGNIGTDRVKVAKQIAEEFDMHFIPDIKEEEVFINKHGFDWRQLNIRLQKSDRFYDLKDLYTAKDPSEVYGFGRTQVKLYQRRFFNYVKAMRHLLSTGQGVVLERSMYSDRCFADAMRKCKYFTREGKDWYHEFYDKSSARMWTPHLIVYIDQPVSECRELIEKRNHPLEKNSPLLTDKFLQAIEDSYKETLLPKMKKTSEVLYLGNDDLEYLDEVMYEMQLINLDPPVLGDPYKFDDWFNEKEWMWNNERIMVQRDHVWDSLFFKGVQRPVLAQELDIQDVHNYNLIVTEHPTNMYDVGYSPGQQSFWQIFFGTRGDQAPAKA